MPKKTLPIFIIILMVVSFSSCTSIYFNTFHNIRKNFNTAEKSRKKDGRDKARGAETKQYSDAITKSARILERHPTSSWIDDALYIIGASYYYLGDYSKSARKFKELLANYPESEFVSRSRLLLAKSKLQLRKETEAIVLFEEIFDKASEKSEKAEAARSLGEYYFESQNYELANRYFLSLIDSLGESHEKLRAYTYIADGYFEKFNYKGAKENYQNALGESPDTLQTYSIEFRMVECEYFLFNIEGGLERLEKLADNELYYDSLAPIRLKMAEGYDWEGDVESAISTYEQLTVENERSEAAAIAYYELALIYQYDFEDLTKALAYYVKARDERRRSSIYADAVKHASRLTLLEQYSHSGETELEADSTGKLDLEQMNEVSENQFLLGELFYFDLDKPDSALHAFQVIIDKFQQTGFAPKALMSMAYIHKNEYADTSASDSLMRQVLKDYAHYDEAEQVLNTLGLSGTVADTGYAALVFKKAEDFLERYQNLEREWYFPFELRIEAPIDTTTITIDSTASDSTDGTIIADTSGNTTLPPDLVEVQSVFVPDVLPIGAAQPIGDMSLSDIMNQNSGLDPEGIMKSDDTSQASVDAHQTRIDRSDEDAIDTPSFEDTTSGSIRLSDLISGKNVPDLDSLTSDTVGKGIVIDSLPPGLSEEMLDAFALPPEDSLAHIDSLMGETADTLASIDSLGTLIEIAIDSGDTAELAIDPDIPLDTVPRNEEYYAALELIDSARYYYQYVIDSFPFSDYSIQARYLVLWTYDKYFAPGDSLLIDLYTSFVDSFPESPYTDYISDEYKIRPRRIQPKKSDQPESGETSDEEEYEEGEDELTGEEGYDSEDSQETKKNRFITDEDGNDLKKANEYFVVENQRFEYPLEAVAYRIEPLLYFQIRIDFKGEVIEVLLMNETESPELNQRIIETIKNTIFDAGRIPAILYEQWFYYTKQITIPPKYKQ
ncbi:MAG: tetratricopeptide repeat protein [candidate division Zixibacteria bacterium]|nr:tetratricopeptide repeat protein [candidate division Zixibacteria bacterium]